MIRQGVHVFTAAFAGLIMVTSARGSDAIITEYPLNGANLGWGWNVLESRPLSAKCVENDKEERAPGLTTSFLSDEISDKSSAMNRLELSANFKIKAATGKYGGKLSYFSQRTVTAESTNYIAHALVATGARYLAPKNEQLSTFSSNNEMMMAVEEAMSHPELSQLSATSLLQLSAGSVSLAQRWVEKAKQDMAGFQKDFPKECGQYYIGAIHEAGEILAILTFNTRTQEDKQKITAAMEGSGPIFSGSADAAKTLEKSEEEGRLRIDYFKTGGSGIIPTNLGELKTAIKSLEEWTTKGAKGYKIVLLPYSDLPNWPEAEISAQAQVDSSPLASAYFQLEAVYEYLRDVNARPDLYTTDWGASRSALLAVQDELRQEVLDMLGAIKSCDATPDNCQVLEKIKSSKSDYDYRVSLPVLTNSFEYDRRWRDQKALFEERDNNLKQKEKTCSNYFDDRRPRCWAEYQSWKGERDNAKDLYERYTSEYGEALRRYKEAELIRHVSDERCKFGLGSLGCLTNKEIEDYSNRIPVNPNF